MNEFLSRIVDWIVEGYPEGVPGPDRVPLFALLKRRLTDAEVKAIAAALVREGEVDEDAIGELVTQITHESPSDEEIERVREHLAEKGWPFEEAQGQESSRA